VGSARMLGVLLTGGPGKEKSGVKPHSESTHLPHTAEHTSAKMRNATTRHHSSIRAIRTDPPRVSTTPARAESNDRGFFADGNSTLDYARPVPMNELGDSMLGTGNDRNAHGLTDRSDQRIAVCLLGLERTFDLIGDNIALLLERLKLMGEVHLFGVKPVTETWAYVRRVLTQTGLLENVTIEPQVFVNLTAPPKFIPQASGRGFMIELWDCAHCGSMINASEARFGWQYEVIVRLRLDLFWDVLPPMPRAFGHNDVHVPYMSACKGANDKFAIGGRTGMERYLTRVHLLRYMPPHRSFTSERFLRAAIDHTRVQRHWNWMFCKMGRANNLKQWPYVSSNAWLECSVRIVLRMRCERFVCGWCGQGCRCWNKNCSYSAVVAGKQVCHTFSKYPANGNRTPTLPGFRVPTGMQLLLSPNVSQMAHNCAGLTGAGLKICLATGLKKN